MEAIDLYKEETAKMEEQGSGHEKVKSTVVFHVISRQHAF